MQLDGFVYIFLVLEDNGGNRRTISFLKTVTSRRNWTLLLTSRYLLPLPPIKNCIIRDSRFTVRLILVE